MLEGRIGFRAFLRQDFPTVWLNFHEVIFRCAAPLWLNHCNFSINPDSYRDRCAAPIMNSHSVAKYW